jgi:class 3 adenylate cyclase
MTKACPRCDAPVGDDARFCPSCGASLESVAGAERKLATLVFADLVGSTELAANLDPEEVRARLAPFFETARSTLEEHGGTVEKYVGDAVMAVFGVPRGHGDDPDRAVAAALELTERVASMGSGLTLRVGVETGEVLALDRAGDLSVTGEPVNGAARLQQAAAPSEVLVGERAAQACRSAQFEELAPIEAKGFPAPLRVWRAINADGAAPGAVTPLVGRDDDLALLELVYRRATRDRVPELVTITGDAGVGKTRLASELMDRLSLLDPTPQTLLGRNPPYGRGIAFWALGEILRAAAGASADDPVGDVRAALASRLSELGAEDSEHLATALGAALGGEASDGDVEDELKRAWRRLVALLAEQRPLVIGIDDAHWADDGLLDLIEEAVFRLDDVPLLVLCTSRPELLERRPDFGRAARNVTQIELRPLTPEAADELALALLPTENRELAPRVAAASGGNPFFAEEVVCAIAEGRGGPADHLPDTVQAAIAARLDLLPASEKRTLQYAAVLGQNFLEEALEDLVGEPPGEALGALMQKALVQERLAIGPGRYGFRHQLIRDVAYDSLPRAERARLHERAAERIAGQAGERYPELAEVMAFHRDAACELEPAPNRADAARRATVEAAEIVSRRGASSRAQELYERAAELAASDAHRIEALRAAAEMAGRRFRGDEAVRLFRSAADVAEHAGRHGDAAASYALAVEIATRMSGITGRLSESELRSMLERARSLVTPDDEVTKARLVLNEAWLAWYTERNEQMERPAREGLELARKTGDPLLISSALDAATASDWNAARHRDAVTHTRERVEVLGSVPAGTLGLGRERIDSLHMMIESLVQTASYRDALGWAGRARDLDLGHGVVYSGWARALVPSFFLGQWDDVMQMAGRVRAAWAAVDRPSGVAVMAGTVSTASAVCGYRGDEAGMADWRAFAEETAKDRQQMYGMRAFLADVSLHRGDANGAEEFLEGDEPSFWWRPMFLATRAEARVLSGRTGADDALAAAEAMSGDNRWAAAIILRTKAIRDADEARLREALAIFEEIECPYQAARTGWLLGDEDRQVAQRTFERLGATLPAN